MQQKRNGKIVENLTNENSGVTRGMLFYTIGLPRSGKSSFATRWMRGLEDPELLGPRCVITRDEFRLSLSGERFNSYTEKMVGCITKYSIEAMLNRGQNCLIDETNTREESIREILEIDIDAQYYLIATGVIECINRARNTNQEDLITPIIRMNDNLQKLLTGDGLDNKIDQIRFKLAGRQHIIVP